MTFPRNINLAKIEQKGDGTTWLSYYSTKEGRYSHYKCNPATAAQDAINADCLLLFAMVGQYKLLLNNNTVFQPKDEGQKTAMNWAIRQLNDCWVVLGTLDGKQHSHVNNPAIADLKPRTAYLLANVAAIILDCLNTIGYDQAHYKPVGLHLLYLQLQTVCNAAAMKYETVNYCHQN